MSPEDQHADDHDDAKRLYVPNSKPRRTSTSLKAVLYAVLAAAVSYIAVVRLGVVMGITALAGVSVFAWLRRRSVIEAALEDNYIETRGLYIARKIDEAEREVKRGIAKHAIAVSDAVDSLHPEGVIDISGLFSIDEFQRMLFTFNLVLANPELCRSPAAEALEQVLSDPGQRTGQWRFEHAEQFRTKLRETIESATREGSVHEVLATIYSNLTDKLCTAAKEVGMENSWNHYNELEQKLRQQYSHFLDKISHSKTGAEVARLLLVDKGLTREMLWNLRKYGLDDVEVGQYMHVAAKLVPTKE